LIITALA